VHSGKTNTGSTVNYTLQSGWQFTYEVLPTAISNSTAGAYRVTISIDGASKKQLFYSVKP
jgi:hypothetical protein